MTKLKNKLERYVKKSKNYVAPIVAAAAVAVAATNAEAGKYRKPDEKGIAKDKIEYQGQIKDFPGINQELGSQLQKAGYTNIVERQINFHRNAVGHTITTDIISPTDKFYSWSENANRTKTRKSGDEVIKGGFSRVNVQAGDTPAEDKVEDVRAKYKLIKKYLDNDPENPQVKIKGKLKAKTKRYNGNIGNGKPLKGVEVQELLDNLRTMGEVSSATIKQEASKVAHKRHGGMDHKAKYRA